MSKTEIICLTPMSEEMDEMSRHLATAIYEETNATLSLNLTSAPTTTAAPESIKKRLYPGNRGAFFEMFNNSYGYRNKWNKFKASTRYRKYIFVACYATL